MNDFELEEDDADPTPPSALYLRHFYEHLNGTQQHLVGRESDPLGASSLSLSHWTSEEKDLFFHAVAVYSRLRPDLISASIGTKNIMEVTTYIGVLEDAILEESSGRLSGDVDWTDIPPSERTIFPIAMEMSEDWCKLEAKQAISLAFHEPSLIAHAKLQSREETVHARRLELRRKRGSAKTDDGQRDRKGEKERRKELKAVAQEYEQEWDAEDFLGCLDLDKLAALDVVLRDAEEEKHDDLLSVILDDLGDGNHADQLSSVNMALVAAETDDVSGPSAAGPTQLDCTATSPQAEDRTLPDFDLELLDPALRPPSYAPPIASSPTSLIQFTPAELSSPHFTSHVPLSAPESSVPPESNDPSLFGRSVQGSMKGSSEVIGSDMSPASRRRLYKRMYMRRKRAEKAGVSMDERMTRLKPGRRSKATSQTSVDGDTPQTQRQSNKSGATQRYKMQSQADGLGFTAERLREKGLDLFRLSNFHKLMRTYNELHDVDPTIVSSISADVLSSLQTHVIHFVRALTKKAFLSRSFERQTKARTKVWRISQRAIVRKRNVKHASAILAGKQLTKRAHFNMLHRTITLKRIPRPTGTGGTAADVQDEEEDEEVEGGDEEEEIEVARVESLLPDREPLTMTFDCEHDTTKKRMPLPFRHLSTLRTVFPPDVYPPCEWEADVPPARQDLLQSRREVHFPTPWAEPTRLRDDECMEDETDDEAFDEEMEDEDAVEEQDVVVQEQYEKKLWEKDWESSIRIPSREPQRRKRKRRADGEDGEEEGGEIMAEDNPGHDDEMDINVEESPPRPAKRARLDRQSKRQARKQIKSQKFVVESDDE